MCILGTRKFGPTEAVAFSGALASNTSLQELLASGHPLGAAEAAAFGEALSRNTTLRSLCLGDNSFGDEVHRLQAAEGCSGAIGWLPCSLCSLTVCIYVRFFFL